MTNTPLPINNLAARMLLNLALRDASREIADAMTHYFDPSSALPFHINDDYLDYLPAAQGLLATIMPSLEQLIFSDDTRALELIAEMNNDPDFLADASTCDFHTPLFDFLQLDDDDDLDDDELTARNDRASTFNALFTTDDITALDPAPLATYGLI